MLTCPTDTGSGGYTHRYFRVPRSREDLVAAQGGDRRLGAAVYGWMGRTPDYKAAYTNTLGGNAEYYGPYAGNARAWYKRAQETVPFMNHAIVNPPVDRHKPAEQVKDVFVCVEKEVDGGIIVSGAKVVATSAAMTHYNYMGQSSKTATEDLDMSLMFIVPIDAPGLKLICRTSYEHAALRNGSPFDYPLSSRFDENDAIFVLDKVFVPWEDVFIYRDPGAGAELLPAFGLHARVPVPGLHAVRGETGFHLRPAVARRCAAPAATTRAATRCCWAKRWRGGNLFWSLSNAMANDPDPWKGDAVLPELRAALAYRVFAPDAYPRIKDIVERTVTSALIYLPSSVKDFANPAIEPYLRRYVRGLARHRLCRADQDHEAAVGRHRHRVRRPARTVRAQLRRRLGGHPRPDADRRAAWRRHGGDGGAGRAMHGRLRRARMDRGYVDWARACRVSAPADGAPRVRQPAAYPA